jgi:two-component system, OmpR family, response regulator MtrA
MVESGHRSQNDRSTRVELGDPRPAAIVFLGESDVDVQRIREALRFGSVVVIAPTPLRMGNSLGTMSGTAENASRNNVHLQVDELHIDLAGHRAQWMGRALDLTEHELQVLGALARRRGRAFSFSELFEEVWQLPDYGHYDAIRSAVKRLRRKLRSAGVTIQLESVRGFGYRLQ